MKKREKVNSEKKIKWVVVLLLVVLAGLISIVLPQVYQDGENSLVEASEIECFTNSDCVIVRAEHCPCNQGGSPQCISRERLGEYTQSLGSCPVSNGYSRNECGQISCGCVNNRCVGVPK